MPHDGGATLGQPDAPARDCTLCPRLAAYRAANTAENPAWFNAPVPSFGGLEARLLIVGMAPGLKGANRTGRPFTGDASGALLFESLGKFGFLAGPYGASADDDVVLADCRITNAVRCVPPQNLPAPREVSTCNHFLAAELAAMPNLRAVLALGAVAHAAMLRASGLPVTRLRFRHGATHMLPDGLALVNSYHVSRYNTATKRLTPLMFQSVLATVTEILARG